MDGCFKILMDEIHRYEGTINQFTGDGVEPDKVREELAELPQ